MSQQRKTNEQLFAQFLADVYVLAWQQYQKYEANITKAWMFQSSKFLKNIKRECVASALKKRYENRYKDCLFYTPVCATNNTGFQLVNLESTYVHVQPYGETSDECSTWGPSVSKNEILNSSSIGAVTDVLPDLTAAFDYDLASKATDTELIQSAIPSHDDPRTTTMHMPVWNEDDQAWHVQEIKREGVV